MLLSPSFSLFGRFLLDTRGSLKVNYSTTRSLFSKSQKILLFLLESCLSLVYGCGSLLKTIGGGGCGSLFESALASPQQKTFLESDSYTISFFSAYDCSLCSKIFTFLKWFPTTYYTGQKIGSESGSSRRTGVALSFGSFGSCCFGFVGLAGNSWNSFFVLVDLACCYAICRTGSASCSLSSLAPTGSFGGGSCTLLLLDYFSSWLLNLKQAPLLGSSCAQALPVLCGETSLFSEMASMKIFGSSLVTLITCSCRPF